MKEKLEYKFFYLKKKEIIFFKVTWYRWHVMYDGWHMTGEPWQVTRERWHLTHGVGMNIISKCQLHLAFQTTHIIYVPIFMCFLCQIYHSCYKDSPFYVALNLTWKMMLSHTLHTGCVICQLLWFGCIFTVFTFLKLIVFLFVYFSMKPYDFESSGHRVFAG